VKFLAFRHVPHEHLGRILPVLENRGAQLDYVDAEAQPARLPDPAGYAGLILMGGPMSVNDGLPYLQREMDWIAAAAGRGQPVLGVCLGAQLIAKALGGRVYRNPVKEIGWREIEFTEAVRSDPLFGRARARETVFHWHGETYDPPAGAVLLASSAACRQQAFRVGQNVYGLQFHLEVTPAMIAEWCEQDATCGDAREVTEPLDPKQNSGRLEELSHDVFGAWCDLAVAWQRSPRA
jgi:GMP synthase (glutamine-hydrolysing)